jgi:hypothetical protein
LIEVSRPLSSLRGGTPSFDENGVCQAAHLFAASLSSALAHGLQAVAHNVLEAAGSFAARALYTVAPSHEVSMRDDHRLRPILKCSAQQAASDRPATAGLRCRRDKR